jgi:surfactin synthase thioesterase subunit
VLTGIVLGFYLAKSSFAENRAITLIGYSLGGVVAFNCMKYLNLLSSKYTEASKIINDV